MTVGKPAVIEFCLILTERVDCGSASCLGHRSFRRRRDHMKPGSGSGPKSLKRKALSTLAGSHHIWNHEITRLGVRKKLLANRLCIHILFSTRRSACRTSQKWRRSMQKERASNQPSSGSGCVERRAKETSAPEEILSRPGIREIFRVHHRRDLDKENAKNQDSKK